MNIRTAMKRFKSFYGGKKKARRIELPEERDAKLLKKEATKHGFKKASDYAAHKAKKKKAEMDKFRRPTKGWFD